MIGKDLSHYRITAKLGEGGMGEVYRAEDKTLGREVALKVLTPELATDPDGMNRFKREAQALAAIDHPNIVTIYSVEEADGVHFFTMSLIEGETLDTSLARGGLATMRFFEIALPIADALAAAHDKGILHRDLKPSNLMIGQDGRVRILDFGLAKLRGRETLSEASEAPTEAMTRRGLVLGTLPYMSPEQLQGKQLDPRSDIFSLGVVLYEMATGVRPFRGETPADLISSILRDSPSPVDALEPDIPHQLGRIISHCMERDISARFQTARDVYNELRSLRAEIQLQSSLQIDSVAALGRGPDAQIRALAVLPLANLSGNPEQEYFADGMTEALITDLAKIGALKVISRTSVMQFKGVHKPLPQIADELGVDAVIEGSVLRAEDRVRITTQLIDARNDEHLWAESYDRDLQDILTLMSEVAHNVADQVRVRLTVQEQSLLASPAKLDPQAHEAYLKGRYLLNQLTKEGIERAEVLMRAAIERDPAYAQAHVGLADCYQLRITFGWLSYSDGLPPIKTSARRALELNGNLADAHTALALANARSWQWQEAEEGFKRAIALSPSYAPAHDGYSLLLTWLKRLEEAFREGEKALELEPLSLKSGADLAFVYFYARRYDEAERRFRELLALHPKAPYAEWGLAAALAQQGRYDEAIETFLDREVPTAATNWGLGYVYGLVGRHDDAQQVLDFLLQRSKEHFIAGSMIAYLYLGLGDKETALDLLEETYEQGGGRLVYLQVDPWLDPLRDHPRFQDLLRRMNFPR